MTMQQTEDLLMTISDLQRRIEAIESKLDGSDTGDGSVDVSLTIKRVGKASCMVVLPKDALAKLGLDVGDDIRIRLSKP